MAGKLFWNASIIVFRPDLFAQYFNLNINNFYSGANRLQIGFSEHFRESPYSRNYLHRSMSVQLFVYIVLMSHQNIALLNGYEFNLYIFGLKYISYIKS